MASTRVPLLMASILVALALGCATAPVGNTNRNDPPPSPYTRLATPDSNTFSLQIALREFVPRTGRGPAIWLSGVSHIGESNYYAGLQRHLDAQSLVLFEGVGARDRSPRFEPGEDSSIQHTLASSLGLVFQLTAIDYDRRHFRNSDLTVPELQRMLGGDGEAVDGSGSGPGGSQELDELIGVMNGSSVLGMLVHLGVRFLGSSPKLQAMTKLAMIETLGRFQGDLSDAKAIPPEVRRLMAVIIQGRNDVVMRDLSRHVGRKEAGRSISVFYGAAHMDDLEKRLIAQLGYRRRDELWMTALTVDTRAAGLTPAELQLVRALVQWQLDALKPQ